MRHNPIIICGPCKTKYGDDVVGTLSLDMRHRDPILTFTCLECDSSRVIPIDHVTPQSTKKKRAEQDGNE